MEIISVLNGISNLEMVMPEFQREFVWTKEQSKQLMVSLFKNYPTGSLLFWETNEPPEIKKNAVKREKVGWTKVILDGQQRLTTLYLLIKAEIPPYYTEDDILNDPRNLFFHLDIRTTATEKTQCLLRRRKTRLPRRERMHSVRARLENSKQE